MIRSLLAAILVMSASANASAECPNVAGEYQKIAGSDGWTESDSELIGDPQITFPANKFSITQDETCMATLQTRTRSYLMKYVPSKGAYVNTYKMDGILGEFFTFKLSISPNQEGVSMTFSRTRNFLTGVAPTYSHWADFKKMD